MKKEEPIEKIDLSKIKNPILKEMVDCGLITEQGIRIQGIGILIRKIEELQDLQDKTNLKLHFIEKKIE